MTDIRMTDDGSGFEPGALKDLHLWLGENGVQPEPGLDPKTHVVAIEESA